jgi:hypothetical protein
LRERDEVGVVGSFFCRLLRGVQILQRACADPYGFEKFLNSIWKATDTVAYLIEVN